MCIEIPDENEEQGSTHPLLAVSRLQFLQERDGLLTFKVEYEDQSFKLMNHKQLRKVHPEQLFDFYEANFDIQFN